MNTERGGERVGGLPWDVVALVGEYLGLNTTQPPKPSIYITYRIWDLLQLGFKNAYGNQSSLNLINEEI